MLRFTRAVAAGALLAMAAACTTPPKPGTHVPRAGDEIVVAGQFFRTGTTVVLWMDPGGYDAYRVERRFSPPAAADWDVSKKENPQLRSPNRYSLRRGRLSDAEWEHVRKSGWNLPLLQKVVDQFVIHYDAAGTSRQCFETLHDQRGLSTHFLLDIDGTLYQTLDLKERAWHATTSNSRSVGIEIANIGAYPPGADSPLAKWYAKDSHGKARITLPANPGADGIYNPAFVTGPARDEPVTGVVQGRELIQYDFTPEQYAALIKLSAALCEIFPEISCDYPRDAHGGLITQKLPAAELDAYQGLLGHYHIQSNKVDPGPAFDWDRVIQGARKIQQR